MVKHLVICNPNTNKIWRLDDAGTGVIEFSPQLGSPETDLGGFAIWGAPTGELITFARKVGGVPPGTYHFYHFEPATPLAWIDKGSSGGAIWSIRGTSYNNVWAVAGDSHNILHFDGTAWVVDAAALSTYKLTQVFASGPGLDEVFVTGNYNVWFRTGGAIGSGVWVDCRAQLMSDTGLNLSPGNQGLGGVWAVSKNEVYWQVGGPSTGNWHWIIKWDGVNFSNISTTSIRSAGVSEDSLDATALSNMWWMQADPSWGRFYFVYFNGTNILRQAPGEVPDGPEHNLAFGCKLILDHPTPGYAYAAGRKSATLLAVWEWNGTVWSELATQTVGLISQGTGVGIWHEIRDVQPPTVENEDPYPDEIDVDPSTTIKLDVVDRAQLGVPIVEGVGVDPDTVVIKVNQVIAWASRAGQNGYSGTEAVLPSPKNGFAYVLTPPGSFSQGSRVRVDVDACDLNGNCIP